MQSASQMLSLQIIIGPQLTSAFDAIMFMNSY